MYLSATISVQGIVDYAQHTSDPGLLCSTFPDLSIDMAFAVLDGSATLTMEGRRLVYTLSTVH